MVGRMNRHVVVVLILLGTLLTVAPSCASVAFHRDTPSSGTFEATAWSFTLLSVDIPQDARQIAHGNVADARMPNPLVERELVIPHLGPLDFLLDIVSIRFVKVSGTWGFPADAPGEGDAR